MRLCLHVITQGDNQERMLRLLDASARFFDVVRVCIGASSSKATQDHTPEICKMYGADVYYRAWDDNMSTQHNQLLKRAKKGDWILIMDDDEIPTRQLLDKLRQYAKESEGGFQYKIVKTTSIMELNGFRDWTVENLMTAIENGEQKDRFTKLNFFLYDGYVTYDGNSHYGLRWEDISTWGVRDMVPEPYIHYKTSREIVDCSVQQALINPDMQGIEQRHAKELAVFIMDFKGSRQVMEYMDKGNIDPEFRDWIVSHDNPNEGTISDFFEYYFLYRHPNQLKEYPELFKEIEAGRHPGLIRHLKDLGGYRSHTVDVYLPYEDEHEYWLPIAHLDLHPDLLSILATNQILMRITGSVKEKDNFDLDPFAVENRKDDYIEELTEKMEKARIKEIADQIRGEQGIDKLHTDFSKPGEIDAETKGEIASEEADNKAFKAAFEEHLTSRAEEMEDEQ